MLDTLFGEPPEALHPVVWMGRALAWLESHAPSSARARFGFATLVGHCQQPGLRPPIAECDHGQGGSLNGGSVSEAQAPSSARVHLPVATPLGLTAQASSSISAPLGLATLARLESHVSCSAGTRFGVATVAGLESHALCSMPARLAFGAVVGVGHPLAWGLLGWALGRFCPWPLQAGALACTFAGRALLHAAAHVDSALRAGQLAEARQALTSLVSRPTTDLSPSLVAAAAIESLAENLVDSWVAPLLAYACFGLPGAYLYRAANTADAMWGYRTQRYEHLGKTAARLDDALTFVPARVGAWLLVLAGPRQRQAWAVWRREGYQTPSPNAGQPMSAIAGQLGVRLEKPGAYVLNAPAREPTCDHIAAARRLVARAMLLASMLTVIALAVRARLVPPRG